MEEEIYKSTAFLKDKSTGDGEAAGRSRYRVLACAGVGILCVLVMVGMVSIIYLDMKLNEQRANHDEIGAENENLIVEESLLEQEIRNLRGVAENVNRTLELIMTFDAFPAYLYCPNKKCQTCPTDWILFKEKCYFFYKERAPWLSWMNSRRFCQEKQADLVVIDNLQEQEFISNHTKFYHDKFHGYFIGLEKTKDNYWVWVDGRNDTLGYWMDTNIIGGPYALFIPRRTLTSSWDPADDLSQNKFICEIDALMLPT